MGKVIAADASIKGFPVGWFAPDYRIMAEAYNEILTTIDPVKKSSSKTEGIMRTITGGRIDFWTLENERAGRSRMYKVVIIDEAAFTKPNMMTIWEQSIEPTLLDLGGKVIVLSNTNGIAEDNFLYQICEGDTREIQAGINQPGSPGQKYGFAEYWAPSSRNPHVPRRLPGESEIDHLARRDEEFAKLQASKHPLVWKQEYLAEFVDWSGVAFFNREALLVNDQPPPMPTLCDGIYCVIDTALKAGKAHDGTAIVYFAINKQVPSYPLQVLDWDILKIEGSMLEVWLPSVMTRMEELARQCKARMGVLGAWIEDKGSGTILLQQAKSKFGARARPVDTKLTSVGKDERAFNVSGYVHRGMIKITQPAYDKTVTYNDVHRNHFLSQVMGFRLADPDAATRADDLLDCFTYGISIGLGDRAGY
jgi:hypothetical protein